MGDPQPRVGIVGAGLAGLAAARALAERGQHAVLFDKGRGPGGRSTSRRAPPFAFDHGAQYFTARDPGFRRAVESWLEAGVVARWEGRIVALSEGAESPVGEATERLVGVPRMSSLARHLARDVELHLSTRVTALERKAGAWTLRGSDGAQLGCFEHLIVTAPPAQAAALIGTPSPLGARAAALDMQPCWSALLGLAAPYAVEFDGAFCEGSALSWICRDSSKPGRPACEAWVLHSTPEWTHAHLDDPPERVLQALRAELVRLTGAPLPDVVQRDAHLWRFARPGSETGPGVLHDPERGLVLAGDAYFGGRIEGAWLSGVAAAHCL